MAKLKGKLGCTLNLTIRYCTPSAQPDMSKDRSLFVCFIEFKGFPRQDLRSPDRGDLRNGFVVCDCELDKD